MMSPALPHAQPVATAPAVIERAPRAVLGRSAGSSLAVWRPPRSEGGPSAPSRIWLRWFGRQDPQPRRG